MISPLNATQYLFSVARMTAATPTLSLVDYLSVIGLSAIVGAGFSQLFNYFSTLRIFKRKNQIRMIEDKLGLYSYVIFQLDKMRFKGNALKGHTGDTNPEHIYLSTDSETKETFEAINHKIENQYYLLKQDILKEWTWVSTLFAHPRSKEHMSILVNLLVVEYNKSIIPEYRKLTGKDLPEIS